MKTGPENELNWMAQFASKLSGLQALIFLIVAVIVFGVVPAAATYVRQSAADVKVTDLSEQVTSVEQSQEYITLALHEITLNLAIIRSGDLDNMSIGSAELIMNSVLHASRCEVIGEIHRVLTENDVYDSKRQAVIQEYISAFVENNTKRDIRALSRLYYNGQPLSYTITSIDSDFMTNGLLKMLFDEKYKDNEIKLRLDLVDYVTTCYNRYYEVAISKLKRTES
jgi:hypothetical protein